MDLRTSKRARRATLAFALFATHCTLADGEATGDGGLQVEVELASLPRERPSWAMDQGERVELGRGYVAVETVEIVACAGELAAAARRTWAWPGIGVAHAHTKTSPRKLGVPGVAPVAPAEPMSVALGTLEPPPGRYCQVRVVLGPADGDAVMLPEEVGMVGRSVVLEGTVHHDDGTSEPFRVESAASLEVVREVSFELSEEAREALVSVAIDASALFTGLDRAALREGHAGDAALANAAAGLQISVR